MKALYGIGLTLFLLLISSLSLIRFSPLACEYWVARPPEGNNQHPGNFDQPWATIEFAVNQVPDNSCTIWVKEEVYAGETEIERRFQTPTTIKAQHPYRVVLHHNGSVFKIDGARNVVIDGFEIYQTGPNPTPLLIQISRSGEVWAEHIVLRNNIIHDAYNNDLLKIHDGSRFITVTGNLFYNQGPTEQHMDVNSVTDVIIQDNIFFNDFAGSGRVETGDTKHFIVIKDSNEGSDGNYGSKRITVRRNIFLNWEGGKENFIKVGNDGKPYHEAVEVRIENNLMIGNSPNLISTSFGISGAKDVTFVNNTVVGDLPSSGYAMRVDIKDANPLNENIFFYNNIWSDHTGTMGSDLGEDDDDFSKGDPAQTLNLELDHNLYWNGGDIIPPGELLNPLVDDDNRRVNDPLLESNHNNLVLPRWNGASFLSGSASIRAEFIRLVNRYGRIPVNSPATGQGNPAYAPREDILSRPRPPQPSLGAYEGTDPSSYMFFSFIPVLGNTLP
jgi:hypothetical protein